MSIQEKAGFDRRKHSDGVSYDGTVVDEIKLVLFPRQTGDFDVLLKRERLSIKTTDFLYAFFRSLSPFVRMQTELMEMLSAAHAKHTDEGLLIEFDFYQEDPLRLTLEDFKEQIETFKQVDVTRPTRMWSYNQIWSLVKVGDSDHGFCPSSEAKPSGPPELANWIEEFNDREQFVFKDIPTDFLPTAADPVQDRVMETHTILCQS